MKPSIIHIITLLHTFISIINAQICGTDCSGCNTAPLTCEDDTQNRCIYNYGTIKCEVDQCGPNCILCDNDETECKLDSLPCFWIVDNNKCRPANDCQSYCALCTNENDCEPIGSGGGGLCEWDIGEQACEGTTCNTNCDECSGLGQQVCEESNALPNGCRLAEPGSEQCIPLTANPTTKQPTTAPSPIPSYNPSISPTNNPSLFPTNLPTHSPTEFPSFYPTQTPTTDPTALPSENPTRAPNVAVDEIVCGDIINNILPANDEKLYSFQLPYDTIRIIISLCNTQTTFATEIVLLDENNNPLATDQPCQPQSQVTRIDIQSGLSADSYFITISGQTNNDFGPYQLELTCVTPEPTEFPTFNPTEFPTFNPTKTPTKEPTITPTINPTEIPTVVPTINPSDIPTYIPTTIHPTYQPTNVPTQSPSSNPTSTPTLIPSTNPTLTPTLNPTIIPTNNPTTTWPTKSPTDNPTNWPTKSPTNNPTTTWPTKSPTDNPTNWPTPSPTKTDNPTGAPSKAPCPTDNPTPSPSTWTKPPTSSPTKRRPSNYYR